MGRLTNDMSRLREEIGHMRQSRREVIDSLKAHQVGIKAEVSEMQEGFRQRQMETATQIKTELADFRKELIQSTSQRQETVSGMMSGFRQDMEEISRRERDERQVFIADLRRNMVDSITAFRSERHEAAQRLREELHAARQQIAAFVEDIGRDRPQRIEAVAGLKLEVAQLIEDYRLGLAEAARAGREERTAFMADIRQSLAEIMEDANVFRRQILDDLAGLSAAWQGQPIDPVTSGSKLDTLSMEMESPGPATEEMPRETSEDREQGEEVADVEADQVGDDLTLIAGIGPERQRQLNEAGIYTFANLAESNPAKLHDTLGGRIGLTIVKLWIDQAKELIF